MLQAEAHPTVTARDFGELLDFIDQQVTAGSRLRQGAVSDALRARYRRQPPQVVDGVAVPHAAVRQLPHQRLIYAVHAQGIPLGPDPAQVMRESMTLLVRYPAAPADHELLRRLEQMQTQDRLLRLFRAGDSDAVVVELRSLAMAEHPRYADEALPSPP